MAVPTERSENVAFPRPLPHPAFFVWATWVAVCGLAYWSYIVAARPGVSIPVSIGFWALALVVMPIVARRSRDGTSSVVAATMALLAYALLIQDALN